MRTWLQGGQNKIVITRWSLKQAVLTRWSGQPFETKAWLPFPGTGRTERFIVKVFTWGIAQSLRNRFNYKQE